MKRRAAFFLIFTYVIEVSSQRIESAPEKFDRERYERSRNRPKGKPFDPTVNDEDALDFVALVNAYGYPAEEHTVKTVDGYKTRIHRIPGSPSNLETSKKPVVFMQHGLTASSDVWVLTGPAHDLAFMLADAGLDVWLGNARGNTYSRNHISLSPDYDRDFWQYSFHEIALYDVTAAIDYILRLTNQQNIIYLGHSMGTTISYVLLSEKPEYNDKIKLVISLSPVAIWNKRPNGIINILLDNVDFIMNFLENGKIYELFPLTPFITKLRSILCRNGSPFQELCIIIMTAVVDYNPEQANSSLVPHMLKHFPAGISAQSLHHCIQIMKSGNFKMFDYGLTENFKIYKQKEPPLYNLSNIVAPTAIFYGKGDALISAEDVITFSKQLPNLFIIEEVPAKKFSHLDFITARNLKELLNDRIVEIITNILIP